MHDSVAIRGTVESADLLHEVGALLIVHLASWRLLQLTAAAGTSGIASGGHLLGGVHGGNAEIIVAGLFAAVAGHAAAGGAASAAVVFLPMAKH